MYAIEYDGRVLHDPRFGGEALASAKCKLGVNSAGSLEMSLPPGHPLYGRIELMSAEREVVLLDDGEEVFRGRVTGLGVGIDGAQSVTAEGCLAYLNDSVVAPYGTYESAPDDDGSREWEVVAPGNRHDYAEWLVAQHNAQTDACKRYRVGVNDLPDVPVTRSSTQWPSTRDEMADKLLEPFGCVASAYVLDGVRYIDFRSDGGRDAPQRIEFGENLLDFARSTRAVDAVTCIVPVGKDAAGKEFGLADLPDGPVGDGMTKRGDRILHEAGVTRCGIISARKSYDVTTIDGLVNACCEDLAAAQLAVDGIEVGACDLHLLDPSIERIRLGEWVFVSARPLGFEASMMCVGVEIDLSDPRATKYVLGAELPTLTDGSRSTATRMREQESALVERMRPISAEAKAAAKLAEAAVMDSWDEYVVSDSNSDPPAEGWSTDQPKWEDGRYIWRRPVTARGDGTTAEGTPALMTGNAGKDGEDATVLYIDSSRGCVFKNNLIGTDLRVVVTRGGERVADAARMREVYGPAARIEWRWQRVDDQSFGLISSGDPRVSEDGFVLTVSPDDVDVKTVFTATLII